MIPFKDRKTLERMMIEHRISIAFKPEGRALRPQQKWFAWHVGDGPLFFAWGERPRLAVDNCFRLIKDGTPVYSFSEDECPGHVAASPASTKFCIHCGVHVDSLRPPEPEGP